MNRRSYYKIRAFYNIISKDLKDKFPLPLHKKIIMWKHGFLSEKYVLYQLDKYPPNQFLSDYHTSMSRWINEPFNALLTNKYIFASLVGKHIRVPETFGFISKGIYHQDTREIENLIEHEKAFVIKPVDGGGGKGVRVIKKINSGEFLVNETEIKNRVQLTELIKDLDNYLITEFIEQGTFQRTLNPESINTMRVLTLIDPQTHKPFIASAVQRVGVFKSKPQDNFTKGGVSFSINLEDGVLGDGTIHPKTNDHKRYSNHPDTNYPIQGLVIPQWNYIKERIIYVASQLPMLKCVGWDFLMTDADLVAIEGNHHPDPDVLQGHGPLLVNARVKSFYSFHNII